jgi:hypothetical protein
MEENMWWFSGISVGLGVILLVVVVILRRR